MIDLNNPADTCLFCGKNAREKELAPSVEPLEAEQQQEEKKEVIMAEREPVPPRPKKRKQLQKYYEQNKEAILADYNSMKLKDFFKRWDISSTAWTKLKVDWEIQGKHKKQGSKKVWALASPEAPEAVARSVEAPLTEHEHYLVLLGWQQAAREFLKAG